MAACGGSGEHVKTCAQSLSDEYTRRLLDALPGRRLASFLDHT